MIEIRSKPTIIVVNLTWFATKAIIENISKSLAQNHIQPGPLPNTNRDIQGSSYFSFRNDGPVANEQFFNFSVNTDSQPQRPIIGQNNSLRL